MCLFGKSRPDWEEDVVFANRRRRRPRSRIVSETIIRERHSPPSIHYLPAPSPSPPPAIIKPATPPPPKTITPAPAPSPPSPRIELVSVEEDHVHTGPRSSRVSVSKKSHRGSRGGEEVYIERERERVRLPPPPSPPKEEYETFRYVEGADRERERRRSRSITYETNPRVASRVTERERVVIEDGGRRKEYYRRP